MINELVSSSLTATERMSLTLSMLLTTRKIYLLITGDAKLKVLKEVYQQSNLEQSFPVTSLLQQNDVPVHVFWSA